MYSLISDVMRVVNETRNEFKIISESQWHFGSGFDNGVPKSYFNGSPFPEFPALSVLNRNKYEWEDKAQLVLVPVRDLFSWQHGIDSEKIRPLTDPNYPPIIVDQIKGHLVIMNGNHRGVSAYIQGLKYLKAMYVNFDDPKAKKYWQKKDTFNPMPQHHGVTPYSASKVFSK